MIWRGGGHSNSSRGLFLFVFGFFCVCFGALAHTVSPVQECSCHLCVETGGVTGCHPHSHKAIGWLPLFNFLMMWTVQTVIPL